MSSDVSKLEVCMLQSRSVKTTQVKQIGNGAILVSSLGDTLQECCPEGNTHSVQLTLGSYLIKVGVRCVLSSSSFGWRYTPMWLKMTNLTWQEVMLLPNVTVNFDVHKPNHLDVVLTFPAVQMEALAEENHRALPVLARMSMV